VVLLRTQLKAKIAEINGGKAYQIEVLESPNYHIPDGHTGTVLGFMTGFRARKMPFGIHHVAVHD
jgi:hypothetical protein